MATIKWDGATSDDAELAANWQGGTKPTAADDVVCDNTASGPIRLTANVSWLTLTTAANWPYNFTLNGYTCQCAGAISLDGTAAVTMSLATPGKFVITGDADFISPGVGGVGTWSGNPDLDLQGTGNLNVNDTGLSFSRLTCAAAGKTTTITGGKQSRSDKITLGGGTFTLTSRLWSVWASASADISIAGGTIVNGAQLFEIRNNGSNQIDVPGFTYSGTNRFQLYPNNSTAGGFRFTGTLTLTNLQVENNKADTAANIIDFNGQTVNVSGVITIGSNSAGDRMNVDFSSATIDCNGIDFATIDNAPLYVDFGTSTIYCSGSYVNGANTVVTSTAGALVEFDGGGAQSITSHAESFPDIRINKSGNTATQTDDLTCGDFTHFAGNYSTGGFNLNCIDLTITSAGTKTYSGITTATGNGDFNVSVTFNRLILSPATSHVFTSGITFTLTNYTAGDWNGTNLSADAAGQWNFANPAGMVVQGITVSDSNATNAVDATHPTNHDGGNNTNWNFGASPKDFFSFFIYDQQGAF